MSLLPKVVFLGTPLAAVPTLIALDAVAEVVAVITQPDRPKGRSKTPVSPPVKDAALDLGIPVFQPDTKSALNAHLAEMPSLDLGVVVAYGMILDSGALATPELGMVNVHFSLLPLHRGAAPVERAILVGDQQTGVTIMQMDEGLDTGDILVARSVAIGEATAGELTHQLANAGASLLAEVFGSLVGQHLTPIAQDHTLATYASKLTTAEAEVDFSLTTEEVVRHVRAFDPRPGAFAYRGSERFKFGACRPNAAVAEPGEVIRVETGVSIGTADGSVEIFEIQPPGKSRMPAEAWLRGQSSLGRFTVGSGT